MKNIDFDIDKIRGDFPILQRKIKGEPLAYLDNAATTLKPQCVVDAISKHYLMGASNIHRGVHTLSEEATAQFEGVREQLRNFIGAKKTEEIIFTKGTTESLNLLAHSLGKKFLRPGDEILISWMEHHSNIVPWQMICELTGAVLKVIPINDRGEIVWEKFLQLLSVKTKVMSLVYISNSLGTVNPIKKMLQKAHEFGALCIVDAAQALAHTPLDVLDLDCDFLVGSAHKMLGPTGVGFLYGKENLLEQLPPYQGGGDMILSVSFEKTTYNQLPHKFEAGTPPIAQVIGWGKALEYLQQVGLENISSYEQDLLNYATNRLKEIEGLKMIGESHDKAAIASFVLEGIHPHDIGTFTDQMGVAIRTGHHCTQPVMTYFKVPATARASFAFYNNRADIDQLISALKKTQEFFL